ncbi:hypothetical protein OKW49_008020 [Paraburkholderia youngii]|uniref:hypothetical protein n=1 Tax=Paraburkholderia youngii TaxID=2782701 RepID=UPI003D213364
MAVRFLFDAISHRKTPLLRRRRWFVVSGGYAASDSSPPAKVMVKGPAKVIVVLYVTII